MPARPATTTPQSSTRHIRDGQCVPVPGQRHVLRVYAGTWHVDRTMRTGTTRKTLLSVGVDIGSSTSHIVFSRLVLDEDPGSRTRKFEVTSREVIHEGSVHLTPFLGQDRIDLETLRGLLLSDYRQAGYSPSDVDTGAVIVTGETARKENADTIVRALAQEAGTFVAATAGPNFEAVLAAHGSGAVAASARDDSPVLNVDVGGGSSNLAVCRDGRVVTTAAINVGSRLVVTDEDGMVVRLERTGAEVARQLGIGLRMGGPLSDRDARVLAQGLADALLALVTGRELPRLAKGLMMTAPFEDTEVPRRVMFSGGTAEYIYRHETRTFGDLGPLLAGAIRRGAEAAGLELMEPAHRIRATVIGAGQMTLEVSGSTTFLSTGLDLPVRDLPVARPALPASGLTRAVVTRGIRDALRMLDIEEGERDVMLAFGDVVRPSYEGLTEFAWGVVDALPRTVASGRPILMCFETDVGNSVGNVMRRETGVQCEVLSIDELRLEEGDFVDVGRPVVGGAVIPVVVKTLVFDA